MVALTAGILGLWQEANLVALMSLARVNPRQMLAYDIGQVSSLVDGLLQGVGVIMGIFGIVQLVESKREHKPDGGSDSYWTIALGGLLFGIGTSGVVSGVINQLASS